MLQLLRLQQLVDQVDQNGNRTAQYCAKDGDGITGKIAAVGERDHDTIEDGIWQNRC